MFDTLHECMEDIKETHIDFLEMKTTMHKVKS